MAWNYQREENSGFSTRIPEGKHRVRIRDAEKKVSKTGNDMLVITLDVSGYNESLYHYIVFLEDKPDVTNGNLTRFFDSFKDIKDGDFNMQHWVGCVGACTVKHEEYNGNVNSKVGYFIAADKQSDLPNWVEPDGRRADKDGFVNVPEGITENLPF